MKCDNETAQTNKTYFFIARYSKKEPSSSDAKFWTDTRSPHCHFRQSVDKRIRHVVTLPFKSMYFHICFGTIDS